ncbi:hypothetical protein [Nitrosospira multiformis]|uniref:hypothetical protein n=1 Tax=Nitrosospira multiformis TaxID=1231 RepID=UPI000945BE07|nr:hypothetical protein [Nitrosospira multiformis]
MRPQPPRLSIWGYAKGGSSLPQQPQQRVQPDALYPDHPQRAYAEIAPLPLKGDAESTLNRLARIIETLDGGKGVRREPGYTYAQFTI